MANVIMVKDILGEDIRSRSKANSVRTEIEDNSNAVIDMSGVVFISRSFADELLAIAESMSVNIVNAQDESKTMLDVVRKSRKSHKEVLCPLGEITQLDDMKSVDEFFSAMQ